MLLVAEIKEYLLNTTVQLGASLKLQKQIPTIKRSLLQKQMWKTVNIQSKEEP
jgi:hypothetical protein